MKEKDLTFEEAIKKLEIITRELENGEIDLDSSINKYKEATALMEFCNEKLKNAHEAVNKILKPDGSLEEFKEE